MSSPKIVALWNNWEPILESEFIEITKDCQSVVLRVPLPSHGRTNSSLDICDELLEASYFCETLSRHFKCGELDRKYDAKTCADYFLLPIEYDNYLELSSWLFRLQWTFNSCDDDAFADIEQAVRNEVVEHQDKILQLRLNYPVIADGYLTNRLNGAYYEYEGADAFEIELKNYPERRFGFFRSPYSNGEAKPCYLSLDSWLVPPGVSIEEAFAKQRWDEANISLLNANLVSFNDTAAFFSEGTVLTIPSRRLADAAACLRFVKEDVIETLWPSSPKFFVSEFKDFTVMQSAAGSAIFFGATEARSDDWDIALSSILQTHRSATYTEPLVMIDWSRFDDEKFEELCYDLVYHDPSFDKSTIQKMGKSRSRDGGRDIVAMTVPVGGSPPKKFIFQCKAFSGDRSLTTSNLGSMSDVIDQYGADGYVVMTSGLIDATVYDRLDAIAAKRKIEVLLAWDGRPDVASLGGQKGFAKFMDEVQAREEDGESMIPDLAGYKQMIARVIVFKQVQTLMRQMLAAYQGNVALYLIALVAKAHGNRFDFMRVWDSQLVSQGFKDQARIWGREVNDALHVSAQGRMISEWAKKEDCWREMKALELTKLSGSVPEIKS